MSELVGLYSFQIGKHRFVLDIPTTPWWRRHILPQIEDRTYAVRSVWKAGVEEAE